MGVGSSIRTRIATGADGSLTLLVPPVADLPVDLDEAVAVRFLSDPDLVALAAKLYQGQAGDQATLPYVIFTIRTSPTIRTTSTSLWRDAHVRFEAIASTQDAADAIARAVDGVFKDAPLLWGGGGYAIPLVPADKGQMTERSRTKGNSRVFRAMVAFSARTREER